MAHGSHPRFQRRSPPRAFVDFLRRQIRAFAIGGMCLAAVRPAIAQCLEWVPGAGIPDLPPDSRVWALAVFDEGLGPMLFAGGSLYPAGAFIARWDGHRWTPLGTGIDRDRIGAVLTMKVFDDGSGPALVVGGIFSDAGGLPASNIAKWDGSRWSPLGSGISERGINPGVPFVAAMAVFDEGNGPEVFVGGSFAHAGDVHASDIAKWNGTRWARAGVIGQVQDLAVYDDGTGPRLYAASTYYVQRWNGAEWEEPIRLSYPGGQPSMSSLAVFDDGSGPALFMGGHFSTVNDVAARNIARWDGSHCTPVGSGLGVGHDNVSDLVVFDDGSGPALYAAGTFETAGDKPARYVAKWDRDAWWPLAQGVGSEGSVFDRPEALAVFGGAQDDEPRLMVGGSFERASGLPSHGVAAWRGCSGPGVLLCFGDGGSGACPCSNEGVPDHGCRNSASPTGGLLTSSGSTRPDAVVLRAEAAPNQALSIFVQGNASRPPSTFGDGLRCVGGDVRSLYTRSAEQGVAVAPEPLEASITSRSAALGDPIAPGSVRIYQVYYRDPAAKFCPPPRGGAWNATNALKIRW